jgi:transposase
VLSWLDAGQTPDGDPVHWTLDGRRLAVAERFGTSLTVNAIWAWLRREGWRPKVPRPRHHSADAGAQAEFKKKPPG